MESSQLGVKPISKRGGQRTKGDERDLAAKSNLQDKTQFQGWTITSSIHARARAFERVHHHTTKDWKEIFRRSVKNLGKLSGDFILFSKEFDQGIVAKVDQKKKSIKVITVLPKGRQQEKEGTDKLIFEQFDIGELIFIEFE